MSRVVHYLIPAVGHWRGLDDQYYDVLFRPACGHQFPQRGTTSPHEVTCRHCQRYLKREKIDD